VSTAPSGRRLREPRRKAPEAPAEDASNGAAKGAATSSPAPAPRSGLGDRLRENWRPLTAVVLLVLGIVIVMLGWYGTAYTNIFTEQIPYLISGGLLGLGLIVVAGFLAVSSLQTREIRELRRDLFRVLSALSTTDAAPARAGRSATNGQVYVVPGGRSFHVPGCPLLEGKEGEAYAPGRAVAAGYVPCKLCGPE
jgi:hypothetical protein